MNHFKKRAVVAALALCAAVTLAAPVRADASCDVLFKKLRFNGGQDQALWTTNYFSTEAPQSPHLVGGKTRFMAATELTVSIQMGVIVADGRRTMQFYRPGGFEKLPEVTEPIRIRIRPDGKVHFATYGPYDPWCAQDRYMFVFGGDSVEVVSFKGGPFFSPGFDGNRAPPPPPPRPLPPLPPQGAPWAYADASCDTMFRKLRFNGGQSHALWTTNYYSTESNPQIPHIVAGRGRFMAATELKVSVAMGEIAADGRRTKQLYPPGAGFGKLPEVTEPIRIRIQPDGRVYFAQYGPYIPWCAQDRYMIVIGGDSVEVVSFLNGPFFSPGFDGNRAPPPPPPAPREPSPPPTPGPSSTSGGKIGEACTANSCALGLTCSGAVCVATPAAAGAAEGASCTVDTTCRQPDLKCGATGVCVKR